MADTTSSTTTTPRVSPIMTKYCLRPAEAAAYLNVSDNYLATLRRDDAGPPYIRLGDRNIIRYSYEDLDSWVEASMVVPTNTRQLAMDEIVDEALSLDSSVTSEELYGF